jgi:hypothetical protein
MGMDMEEKMMEKHCFGKIALKKLGDVPDNFRLFEAGWIDKDPRNRTVMEVKGAEFRAAKKGTNKGKLAIIIAGSQRTVYVTREEIDAEAA